jgi:hypothetical protein
LTPEKKEKQTTPDWYGHGISPPPFTSNPKSEKLSPIQNNQKIFKKIKWREKIGSLKKIKNFRLLKIKKYRQVQVDCWN